MKISFKQTFAQTVLLACLFLLLGSSGQPAAAKTASSSYTYTFPQVMNTESPAWLGPEGGSVVCLVTDPKNANIIYAGPIGGGVYKSLNGGASWFSSSQGIESLGFDSLAIDPVDSNILYAGTHGQGVYKSTDAGVNWTAVNEGIQDSAVVYSLAVNPGNHALVYAGTRMQGSLDGKLYKSVDGGASWTGVFSQQSDWIYSLAVNPYAPNVVLAAAHEHGVYRSTSYGSAGTWESMPILDGEPLKGRAIAFDPRSWSNRAYYATWHGDFYRSTDLGHNWSLSDAGMGTSHVYPNGIVIKPANPSILYLAVHSGDVSGVLRSSDSGGSWYPAGLAGKTVYTVGVPSGGGDSLLAGTFLEGIYKSINGGSSWFRSQAGLINTQVTGVVFPSGSTMLASTIGSGISISKDNGASWTAFSNNLGDEYINGLVPSPANPNILFALTSNAGLRRIDLSAGDRWASLASLASLSPSAEPARLDPGPFARHEPLHDELLADEAQESQQKAQPNSELAVSPASVEPAVISSAVTSLTFAPSNPKVAYMGTNGSGMYISKDSGGTWTRTAMPGVIWKVAVSPSNPDIIFAVTNQVDNKTGVILSSSNAGAAWTSYFLPVPQLTVNTMTILPAEPASVYVGTTSGVWKLTGGAWTAVGLVGYDVRSLEASPFTPGVIYAGTNMGAFTASAANLPTWSIIATESASFTIQSINFNPADRKHIYLGTENRGTLRVPVNQFNP